MNAIIHTKLVMEDGIIWDGALTYENGRIIQVGPAESVTIPADAKILDAHGLYTAPGLIDIHNHGAGEHLFLENPTACAEHFLKHGETTVLPTFFPNTFPVEKILHGIELVREAMGHGAGRIMRGIYMEGPYMNGFSGNQSNVKWWTGPILREEYAPLVDALGDLVHVWAIDPARENIEEFMAYAKSVNPNVIFANGHTHATAEQCRRVRHYGVKVQTHFSDSGQAKGRAQGTPGAGSDQYTLYDPDLYAELICDQNGVHVVPDLIKVLMRVKGVEHVILITDSSVHWKQYRNNEADGIGYGPDLNYDSDGHLCGSAMTLECACRNLMTHTGYGLCHAIRCATLNPARLLGLDNILGSLAPGKLANLIVIDDQVQIKNVILEGETVV